MDNEIESLNTYNCTSSFLIGGSIWYKVIYKHSLEELFKLSISISLQNFFNRINLFSKTVKGTSFGQAQLSLILDVTLSVCLCRS